VPLDVIGEIWGPEPRPLINAALLRSEAGQNSNEQSGERGSNKWSGRLLERERNGERDSRKWI